jgi:hypothetical protein
MNTKLILLALNLLFARSAEQKKDEDLIFGSYLTSPDSDDYAYFWGFDQTYTEWFFWDSATD